MHIHLDVVGGIAGDMFCSAMLDAFPLLEKPLQDFLLSLDISQKYTLDIVAKKQKGIVGKQVIIRKNTLPIVDNAHLACKSFTLSISHDHHDRHRDDHGDHHGKHSHNHDHDQRGKHHDQHGEHHEHHGDHGDHHHGDHHGHNHHGKHSHNHDHDQHGEHHEHYGDHGDHHGHNHHGKHSHNHDHDQHGKHHEHHGDHGDHHGHNHHGKHSHNHDHDQHGKHHEHHGDHGDHHHGDHHGHNHHGKHPNNHDHDQHGKHHHDHHGAHHHGDHHGHNHHGKHSNNHDHDQHGKHHEHHGDYGDHHHGAHHDAHYSWQDIQIKLKQIEQYPLIYQIAKDIYAILAKAESEIHGIPLESIALHEVGADDAILDIISAAFLIHKSQVTSWSCSSLPWGKGTIHCAHGELPIPAPAVLKILTGFEWADDDEVGERITPTGAAILRCLMQRNATKVAGEYIKSGYGCGHRVFKKKPNIVRVNVFQSETHSDMFATETVSIIQSDIDDMSPELLAIAQERIRNTPGVIDVTSNTVMGKKGRWATRIEVVCEVFEQSAVCQKILEQTSSLGVRYWQTQRTKLPREQVIVTHEDQEWAVKLAHRPNKEVTAKLEADTLAVLDTCHNKRSTIKNTLEQLAVNSYASKKKEV